MNVSMVTIIWNGERYGFPWRQLLEEWILNDAEVIVVVPGQDQDDMYNRIQRGYKEAVVVGAPEFKHFSGISESVNKGIALAQRDVVLHIQADEHMEVTAKLKEVLEQWGSLPRYKQLLAFPRLDFTLDMTKITPVFPDEPPVIRGMQSRYFPQVRCLDDGMHLGPMSMDRPAIVLDQFPIFHYHGLQSESQWQKKETDFQQSLYVGHAFGAVDEKIAKGGQEAWAPGPLARAREFHGQHPPRMLSWLRKSWLWREP